MWIVKLVSGETFSVSDNQARALTAGMEKRLPINLGFAIISGTSISAIWDEDQMKIKTNPIISDENFKKWLNGDTKSVDLLNSRFYGDKYDKEWKQALEYKRSIETGEVKLLE